MTSLIPDYPTEKAVTALVGLLYKYGKHTVISKTNYPILNDEEYEEMYNDLCEHTHSNGFDLIIENDSKQKIGIEVKIHLSNTDFIRALGQCLYYMSKESHIASAVIFSYSCEDLLRFNTCIKKYNLPIEIKTILPSTITNPKQMITATDIIPDHFKVRTFFEMFNAISGIERNDVEENELIHALVESSGFEEGEVRYFIDKGLKQGQIYERREGFYAKA